ncbi:hypothetical protein PIB30_092734, partial [Stylosanthes scabra]|nr:hypothetical protein [Stylosanthes scabra]
TNETEIGTKNSLTNSGLQWQQCFSSDQRLKWKDVEEYHKARAESRNELGKGITGSVNSDDIRRSSTVVSCG